MAQQILNNNINRITQKTANEAVAAADKKQDLKNYNTKRAVAGADRTQLKVGDHVRLRGLKVQKQKGLVQNLQKYALER